MGAVIRVRDGLRNVFANLGTARDKASASAYHWQPPSHEELLAAYRGAWLPRKIVDIPALDACRKWRVWQAGREQITALEAEERRHNLREKTLQALIAARLYGGAALYIGTGDAKPDEPLGLDRLARGGLRYVTVLTPSQLAAGETELDPASDWHGRPAWWQITDLRGGIVRVHPSRLAVFHGAPLPVGESAHGGGWGDSVLAATMEAIKQADGTAANVASLVFEAKIDVIGVPNLMRDIGDVRYEQRLRDRIGLAAAMKGINGALLKDAEESYEQKSASFSTLPEVMDRFFQNVAGAADIPMTRLFGRSPAGLNSTGDADLRNYYDRVQAMQQLEVQPALWRLDEAVIRSALGARPAEVYYEWASLWQVSERERADIGKITAETIRQLRDAEVFPLEALAQAGGNALVETGALPGLDAALDAFGQADGDDAEARAALGIRDAAPRTLYVQRKVLNAPELLAWARAQGFGETLAEDDLHVTIAFSREPIDWMAVGEPFAARVEIAEGGPRLMERFGDARVLLFASSELSWRHQQIRNAGASWDHPEYQPHITVSYSDDAPDLAAVEPYRGRILLGPEIFAEVDEDW